MASISRNVALSLGSMILPVAFAMTGACAAKAASPEEVARTREILASMPATPGPGCFVDVLRNGKADFSEGHGLADIDRKIPLQADTVFNIASVSKQFTAFAILLLEREGRLSLSDSIRRHVPALGPYADDVTIEDLLHHTGGLREYLDLRVLAGVDFSGRATTRDTLEDLYRQKGPDLAPSTQFSYSNTGYFLLGQVVERLSGKTLAEFSRERIFKPLGMTRTRIVDRYPATVDGLAVSYDPAPSGGYTVVTTGWEQTGDGQVHTTAKDLRKWDANLYSGLVGGKAVVDRMRATGLLKSGETVFYGGGLRLSSYRGQAVAMHSGTWTGYKIANLRFPDLHATVNVLCNFGNAKPMDLAFAVADIHLGRRLGAADVPVDIVPLARTAGIGGIDSMPAGLYRDTRRGLYLELTTGEQPAFVIEGKTVPLTALGNDLYRFSSRSTGHAVFVPPAGGAPARILTRNFTNDAEYVKVAPWQPTERAGFPGRYRSDELPGTWTIALNGDGLSIDTGHAGAALQPAALREMTARLDHMTLRFDEAVNGKVQAFTLTTPDYNGIRFHRAEAALAGDGSTPGVPVPDAWDYVRLTPEQRSDLRAKANALPAEQRRAHYKALSARIDTLPTWIYEALSNELVERDLCKGGIYTGPMTPPPQPDAWEYVKLVPHQRYHYRVRARALTGEQKTQYEAYMAREMAKLPAWLVTALEDEAGRYDAWLGKAPCPR